MSNHIVTPIVGFCEFMPKFVKNEDEVNKIIIINLNKLINNGNISYKTIKDYETEFTVPYFNANGDHIWGATAMILSEFKQVYQNLKS